ncbi:hypothetical protein [uncultured Methylobacterium sp.]|uniref:hypothetical protein n=1 Tax=uncultured Methylobacterium sp. TaxID=157278 RepID=UPI0025994E75|nr:hypothetical protein [uncultured Methylobacterium sp.]
MINLDEASLSSDSILKIAQTLNLPVASLSERAGPQTPLGEAVLLLETFLAFDSPASRRRCLSFARALARRELRFRTGADDARTRSRE